MTVSLTQLKSKLHARENRLSAISNLVTPFTKFSGERFDYELEAEHEVGFASGQRWLAREVLSILSQESPFEKEIQQGMTETQELALKLKSAQWRLGQVRRHVQNIPKKPSVESWETVAESAASKGEAKAAYAIRSLLNRPLAE